MWTGRPQAHRVSWLMCNVGAGLAAGGLSLAVEGPSKAEISCQDNKDGTCAVSYFPTAPGDYSIIVRFDERHIPGSPFTARITGLSTSSVHPNISSKSPQTVHTDPPFICRRGRIQSGGATKRRHVQ